MIKFTFAPVMCRASMKARSWGAANAGFIICLCRRCTDPEMFIKTIACCQRSNKRTTDGNKTRSKECTQKPFLVSSFGIAIRQGKDMLERLPIADQKRVVLVGWLDMSLHAKKIRRTP